jgi:signal transduction histidine kinase
MAAGMMARQQEDNAFEFMLEVPSDLPDIWGERIGILRVLDNLLTNAIRHNADSPDLSIWLRAQRTGEWVEFEVGDNGEGIPLENQSNLFEFGFRVDSIGRVKGHGMGLCSCRRIVEAHGGRIWVESQSGQGARFCFTLPIVSDSSDAADILPVFRSRGVGAECLEEVACLV